MKIEHIAIWANNLDSMKEFYVNYFNLSPNEKYYNPKKHFSSYFLTFPSGARLELMHQPDVSEVTERMRSKIGIAHFAIAVGSEEEVDSLTERIRNDGYRVLGEPRTTGDGYYESVVSDPEGNLIEITV